MLHSKQWYYSLHRDFQNCYSTRRSLTRFFSSNSSSNSSSNATRAHYTTIQRILHPKSNSTYRRQRALRVLQSSYSSCSRDIPNIPAFQAILQCSSISRESTPFQHSPIRMHILHILQFLQFDWFPQKTPPSTSWAITDITNIHSKKGRCCDIGQIDRFFIIELFPSSSCQVTILIARMTFNCSTSCLMS